jgi:MAGUK p55 subfamily member 3/7
LLFLDTTRPMRSGEVPGREYLFVSREKMEADMAAGKFIEHGEFRGHLYGTSAESVKSIMNAGAVCVMNPHFQAIKALRTPQLKPFIIHVKPPLFDDLKISRAKARAISSHDESSSRGFTDDELHEMLKSAERIEFLYGHFFDETVVNEDMEVAFDELSEFVLRSENESLWAPASWVQ